MCADCRPGNRATLISFTSTARNVEGWQTFATENRDGAPEGTVFIMTLINGKDISPYSPYDSEAEVLVPPNSVFEITGVVAIPGMAMHTITMKQIK